jgi:hypothetical protein
MLTQSKVTIERLKPLGAGGLLTKFFQSRFHRKKALQPYSIMTNLFVKTLQAKA